MSDLEILPSSSDGISIHGARHHNLKNLSLAIPRGKFVVVTGVSGSGKSTLAFDLIFAEGQRRFLDSIDEVRAKGFDDSFCRMWDYYLAYCEGAFRERHISNVQLMLTKNANRSSLFGEPWGGTQYQLPRDFRATEHSPQDLSMGVGV